MLTFLGPWSDFTPETAGVAGLDEHPDRLGLALDRDPRVQEFKKLLGEFKALADAKSFIQHHAGSVELCMDTYKAQGMLRLHAHVWLLSKQRGPILTSEFDFWIMQSHAQA